METTREIVRIVSLHAGDEGDGHAAGEEGIFAVGLLAASPAGIAKDVDVGRPEGESEELLVLVVAHGFVVFGARFGGDGLAHGVDHLRVPGGGHADDLGKVGGVSGEGDAVQAFIPPVVFGDAETRDGRGVVAHLLNLFFEGHLRNKSVDALIDGKGGVQPGLVGGCWRAAEGIRRAAARKKRTARA